MDDHRAPAAVVSRQERTDAARAWRAVPYRRRAEVLRSAKRGERHPDEAAVVAAVAFSRAALAPRGTRWYQRSAPRALAWCYLGVGVLSLVGSLALLALTGWGDPVLWGLAVLGVLCLVWGAFLWDFLRETRHLEALEQAAP